jgi:hypothetical protein
VPHVRLSVRGPKMICFDCFCCSISQKAMVGFARLIRPTYAEANVGHPSSSYWVSVRHRLRRESILNRFGTKTPFGQVRSLCMLRRWRKFHVQHSSQVVDVNREIVFDAAGAVAVPGRVEIVDHPSLEFSIT